MSKIRLLNKGKRAFQFGPQEEDKFLPSAMGDFEPAIAHKLLAAYPKEIESVETAVRQFGAPINPEPAPSEEAEPDKDSDEVEEVPQPETYSKRKK